MEFAVVQRFRCTPDEYWDRTRGSEFDQAMAIASQVEIEPLEPRHNVDRVRVTQIGELPLVAQKALGATRFCYVQEVENQPGTLTTRWTIIPERMADRVTCAGTTEIRAMEEGCERVIRGTISVKLPLVGGTIERYIGESVERGYQRAEPTIRRFVEVA